MGSQALATTSKQHSQRSEQPNKSDLIRLWIGKLSVNAGQALTPTTLGVFEAIWQEGFEDLEYGALEAALKKTLRECSYWPIKVSDVRSRIERAKEIATAEVAEQAWQRVLEIRRIYWNPDAPGGFSRGKPTLSPRIERAARAAGVFRDHESVEALHVWAKKKFLESFTRWDEAGESQYLLPEGEIKNLLKDAAQAKALPAPAVDFHELHVRGLEYSASIKQSTPELSPEARLIAADQLAEAAKAVIAQADAKARPPITVSDGDRETVRKQAEMLKRSFPMRPEAFSENPQLRKVYERFGLEIPELPLEEKTATAA